MAPAQFQNMEAIPLGTVPDLSLQDGIIQDSIDPSKIATEWLSKLSSRFVANSFNNLSEFFIDDCWWKDIVGLAWDFSSKHGHEAITKYLIDSPNPITDMEVLLSGGLKPALVVLAPSMNWIQFGFAFNNMHGKGTGVVKLANVKGTEWKAWIVYTQLDSLNYQVDLKLQPERVFHATKPDADGIDVLIVGCGQAALALGARLKRMGVKAVLVGKEKRIGDTWRARYKSVKLHTPIYTDHYPFLKYSEDMPTYLSRDEIAAHMEKYAKAMNLNILLNTNVTEINYIKDKKTYSVQAETPTGLYTFSPQHVVLATGIFSTDPVIPDIPGMSSFKGTVLHSSEHTSASDIPHAASQRVTIIGSGTSAHDIAEDFVTSGATEVSIIQRGAIFSVSRKALETVALSLWNTPGLSTEEADATGNSLPLAVLRTMNIGMTQMMSAIDKDMLDGLRKAGVAIKDGSSGEGLLEHQFIKGGNFYIDQGANQMIIDGKIKIHRCEEGIREFTETGVILANGAKIDADIVVLATGYQRANMNVAKFLGDEVVEKMENFGFLDAEQERGGWWRPTGVPGFWYTTGSFIWSRQFSLPLALQIAAVTRGLNQGYYESQTLLD